MDILSKLLHIAAVRHVFMTLVIETFKFNTVIDELGNPMGS